MISSFRNRRASLFFLGMLFTSGIGMLALVQHNRDIPEALGLLLFIVLALVAALSAVLLFRQCQWRYCPHGRIGPCGECQAEEAGGPYTAPGQGWSEPAERCIDLWQDSPDVSLAPTGFRRPAPSLPMSALAGQQSGSACHGRPSAAQASLAKEVRGFSLEGARPRRS